MITCILIDDEPLALKQIEGYVQKIPYLNLLESFTSPISALTFLQNNTVDLIYLDIHMPDLSGIEFVKLLTDPPKAIFTTAYREFALDGFKVDAIDYLVKPISFTEFVKASDKARQQYFPNSNCDPVTQQREQFICVKTEYRIVRIALKNIRYIEAMHDYVRIHLEKEKPVVALSGMKKIIEHLPSHSFMRVHRSYIVNLNKINIIDRNKIFFDENTSIPISSKYKGDFRVFLDNNILK